jgi:hypothetical protein
MSCDERKERWLRSRAALAPSVIRRESGTELGALAFWCSSSIATERAATFALTNAPAPGTPLEPWMYRNRHCRIPEFMHALHHGA